MSEQVPVLAQVQTAWGAGDRPFRDSASPATAREMLKTLGLRRSNLGRYFDNVDLALRNTFPSCRSMTKTLGRNGAQVSQISCYESCRAT